MKINTRVLRTVLVLLLQFFSLKIPPLPTACPHDISLPEWWMPTTGTWPPWKGHSSHWPHDVTSPSLCDDYGCQQDQITSPWPPQTSCSSHWAMPWVLPESLCLPSAPMPPLFAHVASPRANGRHQWSKTTSLLATSWAPSQVFVLTIGTGLCGHPRRAVVATGCVMDPSRVFASVMGTKRAKPHLCGYHRRAAVAVGHVLSPPQVFVSTFVPSPVAFYLRGFPTSQQWALMEPNHVPMATTEGP